MIQWFCFCRLVVAIVRSVVNVVNVVVVVVVVVVVGGGGGGGGTNKDWCPQNKLPELIQCLFVPSCCCCCCRCCCCCCPVVQWPVLMALQTACSTQCHTTIGHQDVPTPNQTFIPIYTLYILICYVSPRNLALFACMFTECLWHLGFNFLFYFAFWDPTRSHV